MNRKKHSIYTVRYYPQFQASTRGLRIYPPDMVGSEGDYCILAKGTQWHTEGTESAPMETKAQDKCVLLYLLLLSLKKEKKRKK